jgi:hypothetical protein
MPGIVEIGLAPIGFAALVSGFIYSGIKNFRKQVIFTLVSPFIWVFLGSCIIWFPHLFRPLRFGEDDWKPWALVVAAMWTFYAIPMQFAGLLLSHLFRHLRGRRKAQNPNSKPSPSS